VTIDDISLAHRTYWVTFTRGKTTRKVAFHEGSYHTENPDGCQRYEIRCCREALHAWETLVRYGMLVDKA
jgi:hypothetical protein